jgi:addiction module HigA family antidote
MFIWMTIVISEVIKITKRQPVSVGEMLIEEFMAPQAVTQGQLAEAMGASRRMINEICNNKRSVTVDTALMHAKVFGTTPDFWLKTNCGHTKVEYRQLNGTIFSINL